MSYPRTTFPFSKEVAETLLDIGVIKLNVRHPFTWVSGIKSPIYCDNRIVNSDVKARSIVISAYVSVIKEKFDEAEEIAGIATGGIPFGALIADRLNLPFIYVRQAPKEHGLMKQVEGVYHEGNKVVIIEDHISTGGSSLNAIRGVRNAGLQILGLISIMTYGFEVAAEGFEKEGVIAYSLCDLDIALDVALEQGKISPDEKESILNFRKDPHNWKP